MATTTGKSDGTTKPYALGKLPFDGPEPPLRMELRTMRNKYPDMWNLYLLGMESFQKTDETHPLSFFQIAGIHGAPFEKWPPCEWNQDKAVVGGVVKGEDGNDAPAWLGYCTHSSILFLPWHRPHLALFEAALYDHVNKVAQSYGAKENRDKYIATAKNFRIPYWDWALPEDGSSQFSLYPNEVLATTVYNVIRPGSGNKSSKLTPNPLSGYTFGKLGDDPNILGFKQSKTRRTLRQPDDNFEKSAEEDPNSALRTEMKNFQSDNYTGDATVVKRGKNLTERALYTIQSYSSFANMNSNSLPPGTMSGWGSLEDLHNAVHGYVGGKGHMGALETAAFDPIFWMHHTNIDRLYAIWQALNDNGEKRDFVTKTKEDSVGTYTHGLGTTRTKKTALEPFTKSETVGDYYVANDVRNHRVFGHDYPETVYPQGTASPRNKKGHKRSPEDQARIKNMVYELYGGGSFAYLVLLSRRNEERGNYKIEVARLEKLAEQHAKEQAAIEGHEVGAVPHRSIEDLVQTKKSGEPWYFEWLVNIKAKKHTLDGDYVIHIFIGPPVDTGNLDYVTNATHVGSFTSFGSSKRTGCQKCQRDQEAEIEITGQIPLTMALVERYMAGQIGGLDVDTVAEFLKKELHWRATRRDGIRIPREDVEGLAVLVATNEVTLPLDPTDKSKGPVYAEEVRVRPWITTATDDEHRAKGGLTKEEMDKFLEETAAAKAAEEKMRDEDDTPDD